MLGSGGSLGSGEGLLGSGGSLRQWVGTLGSEGVRHWGHFRQ